MNRRLTLLAILLASLATIAALAYQTRTAHQPAPNPSLAAFVPRDALLTIESPDFAALLHRWQSSPEAAAWLTSANHSVFENSRLFGRLTDAEATFSKAAGIPATDTAFLNQVAGGQSVFAWYDIGKLEFLYITRIPATQSSQSQLLQQRASFTRRHAGNADFYIRPGADAYSTVAFAQVSTPQGDLLLLATREDLIANALKLLAGDKSTGPITQESWFSSASAALPPKKSPPALHMLLNLDRIAHDPHFQTYWIQRNVTWTRQYRAAVSDLYLEPTAFREERALIPKSSSPESAQADVTSLAALAPPETGLARALATEDPTIAITAIQEKLLGAQPPAEANPAQAPDPTLDTPQAGSSDTDALETRIDTPPPAAPTASTEALRQTLASAHIDAVLTVASANPASTLWVPIHSAVVLHATSAWNPQTLAAALQQALRGAYTAANLGIDFHPTPVAGNQIYSLSGPHPLFFAVTSTPTQGNLALLADDQPLLLQLLNNTSSAIPKPTTPATYIATFNHTTQRAPYARLTSLIDSTNTASASSAPSQTPAFFSQNINSLSNTFARLQSERLTQTPTPTSLRQTVLYQWQSTP